MGKTRKSESNFLVQGSILAVASIISRIIGLIYRIPLKSIIGDIGNDYYGTAMEIYSILLLISSYSLPLAVSKLVSARVAKGQKGNAYRIFKGAILFAMFSGTIAALLLWFGSDFITTYIVKTPLSVFALKYLSPTLLIVAILGVFRGFFQGMGTMMPSALSQLLEQISNAIFSVGTAFLLYQYGARIGAVLGSTATYAEAYGATGGTIGTGVGALVALLCVVVIYLLYHKRYKKTLINEPGKKKESYRAIFGILLVTILPVLLSTTIYNITSFLDTSVFKQIAHHQGYKELEYSTMWGIYVGEYKVLTNVPIAIASSISASCVPSLSTAFASKSYAEAKRKTAYAIRFIMVIAIPCAVGMGVLASPILQLLFQDSRELPAHMMRIGAVSIVFYSLSTLSNGILQGINRMNVPVKNAAITLVLHMALLVALMYGLDLNIYAVVWANTFFSFYMCILNGLAIKKYLRYKQEVKRTFIVPTICAAVMGGAVYGIYTLLINTVKINAVATIAAIFVGVCVYGILMLMLRGLRERELQSFPMGNLVVRIAKKLHLM